MHVAEHGEGREHRHRWHSTGKDPGQGRDDGPAGVASDECGEHVQQTGHDGPEVRPQQQLSHDEDRPALQKPRLVVARGCGAEYAASVSGRLDTLVVKGMASARQGHTGIVGACSAFDQGGVLRGAGETKAEVRDCSMWRCRTGMCSVRPIVPSSVEVLRTHECNSLEYSQ